MILWFKAINNKEKMSNNKEEDKEELDDSTAMERAIYLDSKAKLEEAWKEIDDHKAKINRLDIEIANLKDLNARLEQQNKSLIDTLNTLYNFHKDIMEQAVKTSTAITITNGKLNEAIVRTQFIIPEKADN